MKGKGKENKPHIGIFGKRNNGKSSIINCLAQQNISIVSDVAGTTTDPVKKSIEMEGVGPAVVIDTAGIDDSGYLGEKRNKKSLQVIQKIDLAIIVINGEDFGPNEIELSKHLNDFDVPFFIIANKSDLFPISEKKQKKLELDHNTSVISFSCHQADNPDIIYGLIKKHIPESIWIKPALFDGIVSKNDYVLLITPIDSEAPEGRMILPQVQSIRDVLDHDAICMVLKETQLEYFMKHSGIQPSLVVTDSQMFKEVSRIIPEKIPLTGFSVVLARQKGYFNEYIKGTKHIDQLVDGDKILLLESCTHHVSCEDIGRNKIPNWLKKYTGKNLEFEVVPGLEAIEDFNDYAMVIQCGGCVVTKKQLNSRLKPAIKANIPVSNYGMVIAYVNGIFKRSIAPFEKINNKEAN